MSSATRLDSPTPATLRPSTASLLRYALPAAAIGFTTLLVDAHLAKYATETLLIAPGSIALVLLLLRVWDAFSDPLFGGLSDRTRTRWGRRRPWIAAGALPMGAGFWMIWSAPGDLDAAGAVGWLAAALFLFYTGMTWIDMPHSALGAELSDDYHQRTRVSAVRRIVIGVGTLASVAAVYAFSVAPGIPTQRSVGWWVGAFGAGFIALTCYGVIRSTPERPHLAERRPSSLLRSFRDVLQNPHARLLLGVAFLQQGGIAALICMLPFYSEHVIGTPELTFAYIGLVILASFAGVFLTLWIAPRLDKRSLLLGGMTSVALALPLLMWPGRGDAAWVMAIAVFAGLAGGVCDAVGPSLQADIIDYDELHTSERKEGAYFAMWTLVAKTSRGVFIALALSSLEWSGFVSNQRQTPDAELGIRLLTACVPAVLYGLGTLSFARYRLTEAEHARIREGLSARATARQRAPLEAREPQ